MFVIKCFYLIFFVQCVKICSDLVEFHANILCEALSCKPGSSPGVV